MNAFVMTGPMAKERKSDMQKSERGSVQSLSRKPISVLFVSAILILVGVASWKLMDPLTLPIRHVRIEGNFQHLSNEKMQSLVSRVISGGFFNLNVMNIKEELLHEPWVYWVVVQRVWPDGLNVNVVEQTAIAKWNESDLLNEKAQIFSPELTVSIANLPMLAGPPETESLVLERYRRIEIALTPKAIKIESLSLSQRRAWQIQLENGPLIILGRNDVDNRIKRFTGIVLDSLHEELDRVEQIDLRYTNGFAIRWLGNSQNLFESGLENNG
jgi:cell division protein FtsQ